MPQTSSILAFVVTALSLTSSVAATSACVSQSCEVAAASGSTGAPQGVIEQLDGKLKNQTPKGTKCIRKWWESGFNLDAPNYRMRVTGAKFDEGLMDMVDAGGVASAESVADDVLGPKPLGCAPYTLLFARGTREPGNIGTFVGPKIAKILNKQMPGQWNIQGVKYSADWGGDYCAGIPGGKIGAKTLNAISMACPNTKIIFGGYSQGAMVARIGTAFATPQARAQVAGIITFGDPFNGAIVKGFDTNKIHVICHQGDGVCGGELKIKPTHLQYGKDVPAGAAWIMNQVKTV